MRFKKFVAAVAAAGTVVVLSVPAMARGPMGKGRMFHHNSESRQYQQHRYGYQQREQGDYRFGDGSGMRPMDGTGLGFKKGLANQTTQ